MTNKDLERLENLLKGTDFEVKAGDSMFACIILKDPWEGVEFVEYTGQLSCSFKRGNIYKTISHVDKGIFAIDDENKGNGFDNNRINFKSSTQEAYVNQLKAKAFELYGGIEDGDRFENANLSGICSFDINGTRRWDYSKKYDQLFFNNIEVYANGKWAKKLPKRIKISGINISINDNDQASEKYKSIGQEAVVNYMSKCLEKLLNDEVD
jgi:hypothetical protein